MSKEDVVRFVQATNSDLQSNAELGDEILEQVVGGTTATFKDIPVVKNTDKSTP